MRALTAHLRSVVGRRIRAVTRHLPAANLTGTIHATPTGTFAIAASDLALGNVLRRQIAWAADEIAAIRAVTDAGSRVLVVGAHVGTLAVPVARHVRSVDAVEANPDTFATWRRTSCSTT